MRRVSNIVALCATIFTIEVAFDAMLFYKQFMALREMSPLTLFRKQKGLSLQIVASKVDCDKGHLSRVERGEAQCSPELANRLAKHFKNEITRDEILYPEDYIGPRKKPVRSASLQEAR